MTEEINQIRTPPPLMHQTLRWHEVGIEQNLHILLDDLVETRASLPSGKRHTIGKMGHWSSSLETMIERIAAVKAEVQPHVERDLGYEIQTPEMFTMIFFQPSTRNLFSEIAVHFKDGSCSLSQEKLTEMASLHDVAEALAWIGDAALKIGVLREIWTPRTADAGKLSERRKTYESNANMARLADRWGLYEYRIQFDPPIQKKKKEIEHIKGTLVEGVFGTVFLQAGLEGVAGAARFLRP